MERGSAVHAILLESMRVTCYPGRRAGKVWESFALENADALILTEKEYERAEAMAESVRQHPLAMRALEGSREQRLEWEMSGLPCRGTPDIWCPERVTDLKTTRSSKPDEFERYAVRAFYPAQLAWYGEGLRILGLADPQEYLIVAVESEAPYPTTVFRLTQRALEDGTKKWRLWFERLKVHIEAGVWPGYSEGVEPIDVPEEMPEFAFADEAGGHDAEAPEDAA